MDAGRIHGRELPTDSVGHRVYASKAQMEEEADEEQQAAEQTDQSTHDFEQVLEPYATGIDFGLSQARNPYGKQKNSGKKRARWGGKKERTRQQQRLSEQANQPVKRRARTPASGEEQQALAQQGARPNRGDTGGEQAAGHAIGAGAQRGAGSDEPKAARPGAIGCRPAEPLAPSGIGSCERAKRRASAICGTGSGVRAIGVGPGRRPRP